MPDVVELALSSLVGHTLDAAGRDAAALWLRFRPSATAAAAGADQVVTLQISCPWRLSTEDGLLVGSGDVFTPADPDDDPETFTWQTPGATWCDVRLGALMTAVASQPPAVTSAASDPLGGVVLEMAGGVVLHVVPDSSPAPHVESEYWRMMRAGSGEPQLVVGSGGVELVAQA